MSKVIAVIKKPELKQRQPFAPLQRSFKNRKKESSRKACRKGGW